MAVRFGEEGRLEGGGRTTSHHSLHLSDTLGRGGGGVET